MTQQERLVRAWKKGRVLTPLLALREMGVMRLSARVLELRKKGHDIQRRMIERGGKRYAAYLM